MTRMTPEQEAAYALAFNVDRRNLPAEAQLPYDREAAISVLKAAFVAGRLAEEEFGLRVGQALASPTSAELAALTADLPEAMTVPRARKSPGKKEVKAVAGVCAAGFCLSAALLLTLGTLTNSGIGLSEVWECIFMAFIASSVPPVAVLLLAWRGKLAGRRPSRGLPPGAGGKASQRLASAGPPGGLLRASQVPRHTAQAAPVHG